MAEWQVAPPSYELNNYDQPKIDYRDKVQQIVNSVPIKNLKKKSFITISTNVLCADIETKRNPDPADRDIYLPLEISLVKWNVRDYMKAPNERELKTYHWIVNPGDIPQGCVNYARDHRNKHLIERLSDRDTYLEGDLDSIVSQINSVLLPDRTVFSLDIYRCRQDLGCLKWLNRVTGGKLKPVNVYSLQDLYILLIRTLAEDEETRRSVSLGIARFRLNDSEHYDIERQCNYHRDKLREDGSSSCDCCARALSITHTSILLDDLKMFTAS